MILYIILACSSSKKKDLDDPQSREDLPSHIQASNLENGDILQLIDIDQDGQTDVWNTYHPRKDSAPILIKKVLDINKDGMGDIWSFYADDGAITEEHFDMNFDQIVDRKEYYQEGKIISSVLDMDGDGNPEIIRRIKNGKLYRTKIDTNGDSQQDLWQALDKNGKIDKYVQDTDGDGVMDKRVE